MLERVCDEEAVDECADDRRQRQQILRLPLPLPAPPPALPLLEQPLVHHHVPAAAALAAGRLGSEGQVDGHLVYILAVLCGERGGEGQGGGGGVVLEGFELLPDVLLRAPVDVDVAAPSATARPAIGSRSLTPRRLRGCRRGLSGGSATRTM